MKKYKILVCPANDGGCAYYRAWGPFKKLQEQFPDRFEIRYNKNPLGILEDGEKAGSWDLEWDFADMHWADIVMTQNISNFGGAVGSLASALGMSHSSTTSQTAFEEEEEWEVEEEA